MPAIPNTADKDNVQSSILQTDREKARLLAQLELATTALQSAVNKLSSAVKEHYDKVAEIDRLRVHVKENIFYYMQADCLRSWKAAAATTSEPGP